MAERTFAISERELGLLQDFIGNVNARVRQAGGSLDWAHTHPIMSILGNLKEITLSDAKADGPLTRELGKLAEAPKPTG